MAQAAQNMDVLSSQDNIKILANVLKTNVSACTSIGSFYLPQLGRIFLDMLGLYKAVSGIVSETVAKEGKCCLSQGESILEPFTTMPLQGSSRRRRPKSDN
jgi:hypothetical protein